jgi:molybdenum cofactor cytidylyltransferase
VSQGLGALVLAAGSSQRMGALNKLTEEIDGQALVARVVSAFEVAGVGPIVVVTGHEAAAVQAALSSHHVCFVHNRSHAEGMGTSIACGIAALEDTAAVLIALGDLPLLEPATITALGRSFAEADADSIHVPTHQGRRGHPVLFGATHFSALSSLAGDRGARTIIEANAARVLEVEVDDPGISIDIDTPADLQSARER